MIKELSISGFRGFGQAQNIKFAIPNKNMAGSGLTIITGANNSGKTTIIEAIRAFNDNDSPSFSEGKRNPQTKGVIELTLRDETDKLYTITSTTTGGSSTVQNEKYTLKSYVLQSRRAIDYEFGRNQQNKDRYITFSQKLEVNRKPSLTNFEIRIFQIEKEKDAFDKILSKILGDSFQWTIEQRDNGNYYIKYINGSLTHSSEGVGDGIWSIFTICAALFDASPKSAIVIDEPELSLHPALQKRLMSLLLEYSKNFQIIISTHSPYFISWPAITNGAQLIRVTKEETNSKCYCISDNSRKFFKGISHDMNNPHTLGIEANEAFFLEDSIILVEGQEDVVIFKKIADDLEIKLKGDFFGWGVGGAPKMKAFLTLFKDLGYKHVVAILDADKSKEATKLKEEFSENRYTFITLKTDDIRDKKAQNIHPKSGLTSEKGEIKEEYKKYIIELFNAINNAL